MKDAAGSRIPTTGAAGADGEDGAPGTPGTSPVIGVRQENGIWYWTLNDEYILDAEGHKIPTSGQDGKTPIVKVEDGKWLVSYDDGASWNEVGSAGKDGADGDSWFSGVDTTSEDYITIILADAQQTQITLPRYKELSVELSADVLDVIRGQANEVAYTITSNSALPKISVVTSNGWKAKVVKTDSKTGVISVTSPVEDAESSDLIVFVSDDTKTIMELVTLNQTELRITSISVSSQSMTFYDEMGAVKSLVASVAPANATYSLQWTSSDPSVAVVSSEGQITACAEGETTITVTEKYTGLYATCVVSVKTARSESKVGQYIYSDGSIGDSPAGAVARIFWKGDPSASDPMLKEEHPSCTHGLAVSMTTYGFASFIGYLKVNDVNKLPDSLYDTQNIVGYQNTSHLKYYYGYGSTSESNSSVLNNLTTQASAPDYSSGWYIPSVKECSILNNSSVGLSDERFWCSNIWYDAASGQKTVWPTCYFAYGAGTAEKGGAESRKYYYIFAF